ncbi:MAG: DUF501 domain-containing protein [Acidimicrobiales bacterium]
MTPEDLAIVTELLGRPPRGDCEVVVRGHAGEPVVIKNAAHLDDGTPMPTLYWLVGRAERDAASRLEAGGGVKAAERASDPDAVARAHAEYAELRDRTLSGSVPHAHVPSGGVGGTRHGVKCLHAHLAWYLAGGEDPIGRWTAAELGLDRGEYVCDESPAAQTRPSGAVAAVDCGTNSTRLLVLGPDGRRLDRRMRITRLGAGVDRTGSLEPDAVDRTIAVLREFKVVLDHYGVAPPNIRAAATSATRDASNSEQWLGAAEQILGVRPEVIGGTEEGRLSYLGATSSLDPAAGPYLVVDIGGGSTELIVGRVSSDPADPADRTPAQIVSLDVGCVRVSERFLASDPPSRAEIEAARVAIRALIDGAKHGSQAWQAGRRLIGLAGTVSALTVLGLGLDRYDEAKVHHARVSRQTIAELTERLASVRLTDRRCVHGMERDRADVIVGGALVLEEVMDAFGFDEVTASESDILDGIAFGLLGAVAD